MKSYSSYKDSGVKWIGEIPSYWNTSKIKYTPDDSENSFIDGDWIESKDLSDEGIRYITTGNIGEGYYKEQGKGFITEDTFEKLNCSEIFEGDLIISRLSLPVGRSCVLPMIHDKVVTSVDNVILRPKKHLNKYYLNYQFNSPKYFEYTELISRGVTLTRISRGMLGNNPIVIPPLNEQTQIVSFLDIKTQKIDELIENTQQKIKLLKEKRTSLINHCVTKGLNPNVEMKDSGVEWIGEIPIHWDRIKLGWISKKIGDGLHSTPKYVDSSDYYFINGNNLVNGKIKIFESTKSVSEEEYNKHFIQLDEKTILLSINGTIGNLSFYNNEKVILGKSSCYINLNKDINQHFIYYVLRCKSIVNYFTFELTGTTIFNLSLNSVKNTPIVFPPDEEQTKIIKYLDEQTQKIDSTIEKETQRIELLKEYRQSLISEVVTGKVDVRDWNG
jgi:type I restriction enzyme, S subunit